MTLRNKLVEFIKLIKKKNPSFYNPLNTEFLTPEEIKSYGEAHFLNDVFNPELETFYNHFGTDKNLNRSLFLGFNAIPISELTELIQSLDPIYKLKTEKLTPILSRDADLICASSLEAKKPLILCQLYDPSKPMHVSIFDNFERMIDTLVMAYEHSSVLTKDDNLDFDELYAIGKKMNSTCEFWR